MVPAQVIVPLAGGGISDWSSTDSGLAAEAAPFLALLPAFGFSHHFLQIAGRSRNWQKGTGFLPRPLGGFVGVTPSGLSTVCRIRSLQTDTAPPTNGGARGTVQTPGGPRPEPCQPRVWWPGFSLPRPRPVLPCPDSPFLSILIPRDGPSPKAPEGHTAFVPFSLPQ